MKVSIVIPVHNEQDSIVNTIRRLEGALNFEHEVVVVNDHSGDKTLEVLNPLISEIPFLKLVDNKKAQGFANTLNAGFQLARGEYVVCVMADLCDDPLLIPVMFEKIKEGFDIVCGSRYMKKGERIGGPKLKAFFSRFFSLSLHSLIGVPTHDIANSFKMYRRQVLEDIKTESKGFEISVEIPLKAFFAGYKISEVPTIWTERKSGESKFHLSKQGLAYLRLYLWAMGRKVKTCLLRKK